MLKIWKKIKSWLHKSNPKISELPQIIVNEPNQVTLKTIKQNDDVWVKIEDSIFLGWVVEKTENKLFIVYSNEKNWLIDIICPYERPFNKTELNYSDKTIFLNKPDDYN